MPCSGCRRATPGTSLGEDGAEPLTLTVSATFRQSDPDGAATRVQDLTDAIADLRDATSSGWVGRQDDVTGYLSELSGGRYQPADGGDEKAAITGLMDEYGGDLFGVEAAELSLGRPSSPTIADVVSVKADAGSCRACPWSTARSSSASRSPTPPPGSTRSAAGSSRT